MRYHPHGVGGHNHMGRGGSHGPMNNMGRRHSHTYGDQTYGLPPPSMRRSSRAHTTHSSLERRRKSQAAPVHGRLSLGHTSSATHLQVPQLHTPPDEGTLGKRRGSRLSLFNWFHSSPQEPATIKTECEKAHVTPPSGQHGYHSSSGENKGNRKQSATHLKPPDSFFSLDQRRDSGDSLRSTCQVEFALSNEELEEDGLSDE